MTVTWTAKDKHAWRASDLCPRWLQSFSQKCFWTGLEAAHCVFANLSSAGDSVLIMVYPNSFGHTTKRPSLNSCNHTCYNTWTFEKLLKAIPFKILGILQEQGKNSCCCKKYLRLPWPLWLSWLEVLPQRKGQWFGGESRHLPSAQVLGSFPHWGR